MADLFIFFSILSVFIISFGIAFQSILEPNEPPSWNLLADLLWRPYWQMFGELFVEDADLGARRASVSEPVALKNDVVCVVQAGRSK